MKTFFLIYSLPAGKNICLEQVKDSKPESKPCRRHPRTQIPFKLNRRTLSFKRSKKFRQTVAKFHSILHMKIDLILMILLKKLIFCIRHSLLPSDSIKKWTFERVTNKRLKKRLYIGSLRQMDHLSIRTESFQCVRLIFKTHDILHLFSIRKNLIKETTFNKLHPKKFISRKRNFVFSEAYHHHIFLQ